MALKETGDRSSPPEMSPLSTGDEQANAGWDLAGDGLSEAQRQVWRRQTAALCILDELDKSPTFWREVDLVRDSPARVPLALRIAGSYRVNGANRKALARVILKCALEEDQRAARSALLGAATAASAVSSEERGHRGTYLLGESFAAPMSRAAACLASRGAVQATRSEVRRLLELAVPVVGRAALPVEVADELEGYGDGTDMGPKAAVRSSS